MTRVDLDVEENRAISLEPMTQLELPESQHRWVTAGCLLSSLLVCGDRCGSIYKYGLSLSADVSSQNLLLLVKTVVFIICKLV